MKKNKCLYADHRCIVMSFHGLKMILVFANLIIGYWYFGVFIDVGGKENQEKRCTPADHYCFIMVFHGWKLVWCLFI